jgi:hypothetical protein
MKSRRMIAVLLFTIIAVIGAVRWNNRSPEAASPRPAVVMECAATVAGFEMIRYDRSVLTAAAPDLSIDGSCAEALSRLLTEDFQIRSILAPQYGNQYYVLSK